MNVDRVTKSAYFLPVKATYTTYMYAAIKENCAVAWLGNVYYF